MALLGGCAALFIAVPEIDLAVAAATHVERVDFMLSGSAPGNAIRGVFLLLFASAACVVLFGLCHSLLRGRRTERPRSGVVDFLLWLFLASAFVVGPGLVANTLMKDQFGRARPHHLAAFGGDKFFTAAFVPSDQCARNCSFVGGESSSAFMLFFALALAVPRRRRALIQIGIAAGALIGSVRILQGAHFLSDIVVSGVLMWLVAVALHWVVMVRLASYFHDGRPEYRAAIDRSAPTAPALPVH
ncbi:MAG: phosphatase PAP2 family protein [Pseudomonadota bacterium]